MRPPQHDLQALDDRQLVARARAARLADDGRLAAEALAVVWLRHEGLVRAIVARRTPREEVDDVAAGVWERFLRAVWRMSATVEAPAALLVTLARRAVADFHEGRRPPHAALEEADAGVDGGVAETEAEIAFAELLAPLDARQRRVVEMRVRDGLSSAQTGEALGITSNNVDQILFRALERLRAEAR